MQALGRTLSYGSQAASYLLGSVVLITALVVLLLSGDVSEVSSWVFNVLGVGFTGLLGLLVFITLFSFLRMRETGIREAEQDFWLEVGVQSANGVTTLALTFTLLGISLGIASLAGQDLTPETVQVVIRELTANFSLAFMTTVVGLPLSATLRSIMLIQHGRLQLNSLTPVIKE